MKKTYINPTLLVVKIQPAQFIATSTPGAKFTTSGSTTTMDGRGSRFSDWDEEDYE